MSGYIKITSLKNFDCMYAIVNDKDLYCDSVRICKLGEKAYIVTGDRRVERRGWEGVSIDEKLAEKVVGYLQNCTEREEIAIYWLLKDYIYPDKYYLAEKVYHENETEPEYVYIQKIREQIIEQTIWAIEPDDYITVKEASEIWGREESVIRRLCLEEKIDKSEYKKSGSTWLIRPSALKKIYKEKGK